MSTTTHTTPRFLTEEEASEFFGNRTCFQCKHGQYDTAQRAYVCGKTRSAIGGNFQFNKPNSCKDWAQA